MTTQVARAFGMLLLCCSKVTRLLLKDEIHSTIMEYQRGAVLPLRPSYRLPPHLRLGRHLLEASRALGLQARCCALARQAR